MPNGIGPTRESILTLLQGNLANCLSYLHRHRVRVLYLATDRTKPLVSSPELE